MNENCASFPLLGGYYTRRPDRTNHFSDVRTEVWTPIEADDRDLIYGTGLSNWMISFYVLHSGFAGT